MVYLLEVPQQGLSLCCRSVTLCARDFASAYDPRCVGLQPKAKIPAAGEKNLWYPRISLIAYYYVSYTE